AKPLFCEFRMFALNDHLESGYWEAPPLYPRSLLYMVSGMFERVPDAPLLGMGRYFTNGGVYHDPDVETARAFVFNPTSHSAWSIAKGDNGLSSDATRHGSFCNTGTPQPDTMASVLYLLKS